MTRRTAWIVGFLGGFLAWVAAELWAAYDHSSNTVPLTNIIVEHVPMWAGFPLIVAFSIWLTTHFWIYWRKRPKP